jgi:hypothetical protein
MRMACVCARRQMVEGSASVRVSRKTLNQLERLRTVFHTRTADETIRKLIADRRGRAVNRLFASGKGRATAFSEEDRLATHD